MSGFARKLERELNAANERIRLLIAERDTARRQADQTYKLREEFRELLGTDDVQHGVAVVRGLQERIKRLEEELERTKEDRNAIAKNTREPLLLKLDHANERISKLNDYVAALETAGDLMANELSYGYDVDMWNKAKEAKP
jgi:DNA repair exonuclease SbcCD ATPase subunit